MKKLFFPLFAVLLLFTGCEFYDIGPDVISDDIVAYANSWQRDENDRVLYQDFSFPEITQNVLERGSVSVSMVNRGNKGETVLNALPYVFPVSDGRQFVMQNIRYEVRNGLVTIVMEWGNREMYAAPTENYRFRVSIIRPD
ncbi:MAG: hypothetical protein MJZ06_08040 [Bacteroidaceae bacterium]|nr:hypothetical protein [Bacteroidaceae bacterium]